MTKKEKEAMQEFQNMEVAADLMLRYIGMDVDENGYIYYYDEDENVSEKIYIDGFACKYPAFPINDPKSEIILDVYNNTKICSHLVHYYNKNIMHYDVDISYITNARMDTIGRFEVRYANGAVISSNVYNKDPLKYIDFIMKMEEAVPMDFDRLRELDIK